MFTSAMGDRPGKLNFNKQIMYHTLEYRVVIFSLLLLQNACVCHSYIKVTKIKHNHASEVIKKINEIPLIENGVHVC